jgi:hypothetical protein
VFAIDSDSTDNATQYTLLAVTHFGGKSIADADISDSRKKYALPIAPNQLDIHNRQPLQTLPAWPDNYSYQVLIPITTMADRIH